MKIPKNIKWAAAIAAVCLAAYSASAGPNDIGFKFVADDGLPGETLNPGGVLDWSTNVDGLAPAEKAGVPPFVQAHWNNLGQYGTNVTLMDSNGTPTAVKASWYAAGMFYASYNGDYPLTRTNDTKLMDGFLECTWSYDGANVPIPPGTSIMAMPNTDQPIIFLTGLDTFLLEQGGGTYSIIIYANTDGEGQGRVGQYFVDAASGIYDSIVDNGPVTSIDFTTYPPTSAPTPVYFDAQTNLFNGSNYTLIPVSATNNANAAWGNYIEFDGLTNDTILIRTQNSGSPGAPINAIQIVTWGMPCLPRISLPVISPTNVISLGTTVTISAAAHVCGTAFYQWQTDGGGGGSLTNIPDATNSSVVSTPTTVGAWKYDVVLTNSYGSLTSGVATVTVLPESAPIVTQDTGTADFGPVTNLFAFIGGNVNFYANFGLGTLPITNQWLFNTGAGYVPIAGAANNSWTVTNVQSSSAGFYKLAATNAIGRSNSTPAHLTALATPAAPSGAGVTNMYSYCVYTNHPWAYWKFEETNDTLTNSMQAYDYSGHNFDATYGNSDGTVGSGCLDGGENISLNGQYGPNPNDFLNGYPGLPSNNGCAGLNSYFSNGYLKMPPLNLNTNTVTITMWIYPNDPTGVIAANSGLLMNRNGSDAAGVGFSDSQNANFTAALGYTWNNNSLATYGWNSRLFPLPQVWSFVAYVISPTNTTIYLCYVADGGTNLFKAVSNLTNAPEAFSGGTTWIGGDNWDNNRTFNGSIDEVAVFTNALNETRIVDLFLKALGGLVPPPPTPWPVEPTNTTLFLGQTLQLTAIAGGFPAPHYQWQVWYNSTWMNLSGNPNLGIAPTTNTTLYWTNFVGAFSNFRCFATNYYYGWSSISSTATVTVIPVANWNKGLWTVNFAITPPDPYGPYVGRGVLGTNTYWNALHGSGVFGGMQFTNTSPSLRDNGVTVSGINFGSAPIYMGTVESVGSNNALLDTYCHFVGAGAAFAFTSVPNGTYNLALYGIDGAYTNLGTIFTVNGVSQSVINAQDSVFLPDNTVVYTNVVVTNGTLNVTMVPIPRRACPMWGCPGAFNGAQLELIQYPPPPPIEITNINGQLVLQWSAGWKLLQATNVLGPWTTNNWLPPQHTLTPTGQMQFFRVCTNSSWE